MHPLLAEKFAPAHSADLHHEARRTPADPAAPGRSASSRPPPGRGGGATGRDSRRVPPVEAAGVRSHGRRRRLSVLSTACSSVVAASAQ